MTGSFVVLHVVINFVQKLGKITKNAVETDDFYRTCSLSRLGGCGGRISIEHAIIFAGRQLDEPWALIPLCAKHHGVDQYQDVTAVNKERSEWVALNRATDQELLAVSKVINYIHKRNYLNEKFGHYN